MAFVGKNIHRLGVVVFGGIGDVLLFSPVIAELKHWLPAAHLVLFVEDRSASVVDLLGGVDTVVPLSIQGKPRHRLFLDLSRTLKEKYLDAVLCIGSSAFIPPLLMLSGAHHRVGYQPSGWLAPYTRPFLTTVAPLHRKRYAAEMYFRLATTFLRQLFGKDYVPVTRPRPVVAALPDGVRRKVQPLLRGDDGWQKRILIHPGVSRVSLSKGIIKTWSAANWANLILTLSREHRVYLAGGPDDEAIVNDILALLPTRLDRFRNLFGHTQNLQELAALIDACDCFVGVDSAPMHLAVALDKPVVAMFGPTDASRLLPDALNMRAVMQVDLPCRPCLWDVRQSNCATPVCLNVTSEAMLEAIEELLQQPAHPHSESAPQQQAGPQRPATNATTASDRDLP
ncbi:MAG: glycosyltransferase family 9 protein [Candidatus Melainabacteria bacterium]|nr:glycosyltransferase family 9 protein [Candidatus Melainabacteria bacterium]